MAFGRRTDGRFSVEVLYGSDQHTPKLVVLKEEAKKGRR